MQTPGMAGGFCRYGTPPRVLASDVMMYLTNMYVYNRCMYDVYNRCMYDVYNKYDVSIKNN